MLAQSRTGIDAERDGLGPSLALARRLVHSARTFAVQLGLGEFGDLELPPIETPAADVAGLQATAALYLASELEAARLVPAMEILAGVYASGSFQRDLGPAGPMLLGVWRHRNQRFARTEREAFFARLFGSGGPALASPTSAGSNIAFESLMIDLTGALYRVEPSTSIGSRSGRVAGAVAVRSAARALVDNLAPRTRGMTMYAAGEVITAVREAIAIFSQPQVRAAFGGATLWEALRSATRQLLNEEVDLDARIRRGRNGQLVLAWLAAVAPMLGSTDRLAVQADDPVVAAAATWLEVSLSLAERQPALTRQ